ncbi:MAG: YvcK family protein [Deltaproteobacteria bacterium]|nr:YvcK family protein [Deltaproteobacteria bacterium]
MTPKKPPLIQHLVETVLHKSSVSEISDKEHEDFVRNVHGFDCSTTRVVIFGGGTGLSTVIGGNSQLADWPDSPMCGLKKIFPQLDVVVCTTDDGKSTGRLLQELPMIGIGDLRKACLSMVIPENLQKRYDIDGWDASKLIRLIHGIFNYRFAPTVNSFRIMENPLLAIPRELRRVCPEPLGSLIRELGVFFTPQGPGPAIKPSGHCLGNLLLSAAIFNAAGADTRRTPDNHALTRGLDRISTAIGVPSGRLHPVTATPGQLVFRYANGIEVYGENKSAAARRGVPVSRVDTEYTHKPDISPALLQAIKQADMIIVAPGSVYTSILPILRLYPVSNAIRANRRAIKILAANFWAQEGETDISHRSSKRGFRVSELIEAYDHNVPGGAAGLFQFILSANLAHIPGSILRNYELEGKTPIHLDRERVKKLGIQAIEATLFSPSRLQHANVIHHDPEKFALSLRTLLYACKLFKQQIPLMRTRSQKGPYRSGAQTLCSCRETFHDKLQDKLIRPKHMLKTVLDLCWENRDIRIDHLDFFRTVRIVSAGGWNRNTKWDNVLGYYDPADRTLKLHEQVTLNKSMLNANLLIALGESLLGNYKKSDRWLTPAPEDTWAGRSFEITLRPANQRHCFLTDSQLHTYLQLTRMVPNPRQASTYRINLNSDEGFLPPGLLFGLMYAWYLNNVYSPIMENEMALLQWPATSLIPHHVQERRRKQNLITFFRTIVFRHTR